MSNTIRQEKIKELLNDNKSFDFILPFDFDNHDSNDDIQDYLYERIQEEEIIYYSNAIEYLSKEYPSLRESFEIAEEYGCELKDLDSEKLATMLYQRNLESMAYDLAKKIHAIIEETEETEEEE